MTIYDLVPGHLRGGGAVRPKEGDGASRRDRVGGIGAPDRADKVEISAEGKALAAQQLRADEGGEGLSPERLEVIRRRMEDGTYDSPRVAEEVARRLLDSGDLLADSEGAHL